MITFENDSGDNKVLPTILGERLQELIAVNEICLYDVDRYRNKTFMLDFENLCAVDYSDVLQEERLKRIATHLTESDGQYEERDLNYLTLRNALNYSWNPDIRYWFHLKNAIQSSFAWGMFLRELSCQENLLSGQPYWLRNEQINLLHVMEPEMQDMLLKVELVMKKSNKIFPQYSALKANHLIILDSGIYPFLLEWAKLLLSGYRIRQIDEKSDYFTIKEPFKTSAMQMLAIVRIIRGNESAYAARAGNELFAK